MRKLLLFFVLTGLAIACVWFGAGCFKHRYDVEVVLLKNDEPKWTSIGGLWTESYPDLKDFYDHIGLVFTAYNGQKVRVTLPRKPVIDVVLTETRTESPVLKYAYLKSRYIFPDGTTSTRVKKDYTRQLTILVATQEEYECWQKIITELKNRLDAYWRRVDEDRAWYEKNKDKFEWKKLPSDCVKIEIDKIEPDGDDD